MSHVLTSDNTQRACSRCRKDLTDPASRECGVGPICRQKNNDLFAKTIPANLPIAGALILGIDPKHLPIECQERWENFKNLSLRQMEKVQKRNPNPFVLKVTGSDFRTCIEELDFFLSFSLQRNLRDQLIRIVEALGYVGLAGVLSGESSLSKATVWFENGKVFLQGLGCTPGYRAMRKLPGVRTPHYRGDRSPYSAPASCVVAFLELVRKHWPLYEGDLDNILQQCLAWLGNHPETVSGNTSVVSDSNGTQKVALATLTKRSEDFVVSFVWDKDKPMWSLLADFKGVVSTQRQYNPVTKEWSFLLTHYDTIRDAVQKLYGAENVEEIQNNDVTPSEVSAIYNSKKRRYRPRSSRNIYRTYWRRG